MANMNLINEITNTKVKRDNIVSVHNNINKAIVNLGGTNAVNLAKVPENLAAAAKKNKKFAILKPAKRYDFRDNTPVDVPLNLSFDPTSIYIEFNKLATRIDYYDIYDEYIGGYCEKGSGSGLVIYRHEYCFNGDIELTVTTLNKEKFTLTPDLWGKTAGYRLPYIIERIVAIG